MASTHTLEIVVEHILCDLLLERCTILTMFLLCSVEIVPTLYSAKGRRNG
jgi:hypothetical protein